VEEHLRTIALAGRLADGLLLAVAPAALARVPAHHVALGDQQVGDAVAVEVDHAGARIVEARRGGQALEALERDEVAVDGALDDAGDGALPDDGLEAAVAFMQCSNMHY